MEVDRAAGLVFGGFAVRDADLDGQVTVPGELVEVAFDGLLGAPPQLACVVVPHDVGGVVVAVGAERLAEPGILAGVAGEAGGRAAVLAGGDLAAGVAGLGRALAAGLIGAGVLSDRAGVDLPEGGGGEGDEDGGMGGDRRGDALAADEPGADHVVGVAAVGFGAAGAGGDAAVAAGLVDHAVRHPQGGDGPEELTGSGVDVADAAAQAYRAGAGGGMPDVIEPSVIPG